MAQFKQDIDFPNSNFYFMYRLKDESGEILEEHLNEIVFFEPKTGKPLGSGIGDTFDNELVLAENYQFPTAGTYKIALRQFMRVDSIPGILRVGVRIEQSAAN